MNKEQLEEIVKRIAKPGFRNAQNESWPAAMAEIESLLSKIGKEYDTQEWVDDQGISYKNFSLIFPGVRKKKIIIGAHYDTYSSTPGADDNASAVATLIAISQQLKGIEDLNYTVEAVFYSCEEPPYFGTKGMGSYQHALSQTKQDVELMISLEMVGYFSEEDNSQEYPFPILKNFYGHKANYLMIVSNLRSIIKMNSFFSNLKSKEVNYKKIALPNILSGLDWSDHRNYWQKGIPAMMLTDTGMFRNPHYHEDSDKYDTLDYAKMEKLVSDLVRWLSDY